MIDILFTFGSELVIVRITGNSIFFGNTSYGAQMAPLEGLKISKDGVLKEFPELKEDKEWRLKAIQMFREKIRTFPTERMKAKYIIEDLEKYGYKFKTMQEAGKRMEGRP